ncbi:phytanoyl-CoA dioxygenase family protein [Oceanospirillum beijerinckii]|uniref:phytanoyl-CoA dioxygenase family protein n=1 Tax=Oceanospirillum beijerinckii TaxID=64976 RepID=UPI0004069933|nr:phytanoyl-CoA dioxygenase family protein [Oceanospirillum beijerinckii]
MYQTTGLADKYNDDGFIIIEDSGISKDLVLDAKQAVYRILKKEYQTGIEPWCFVGDGVSEITRISQVHLSDPCIYKLLTSEHLGKAASQISGAKKVKIWGSQLYYKPVGAGKQGHVGLHRDSEHVPFFAKNAITMWLPLTDILMNSGPITYVKESHQWETKFKYSGGHIQDINTQKALMRCECPENTWQEEYALIPAGGVCFHHMDTLHGSGENHSDLERIAIAVGLVTDKTCFDDEAEDFGYAAILDDDRMCPTIFAG